MTTFTKWRTFQSETIGPEAAVCIGDIYEDLADQELVEGKRVSVTRSRRTGHVIFYGPTRQEALDRAKRWFAAQQEAEKTKSENLAAGAAKGKATRLGE